MENYEKSFANVTGSLLEIAPDLSEDVKDITSCLQGISASFALYKQLIDAEATRWKNNMSPMTAEIDILEHCYGVQCGILRRPATGTIYNCKVVINNPCFLNPDEDTFTDNVSRKNDAGEEYKAIFTPVQSYEFKSAGTYIIQVVCQQTGPIQCDTGSITTILSPKEGLVSIANTSLVSLGTYAETKQHFQARVAQRLLYGQGSDGTAGSIEKELESDLQNGGGVERAKLYDNPTTSLLHNKIPAGTSCIVCYGGTESKIVNCLQNCHLYGAFYGDPVLGRVVYVQKGGWEDRYGNIVNGDSYPITYNVATPWLFDISITFSGETLGDETDFINYITDYITEHRICDFMKTITKNDILYCILQYLQINKITKTVYYELSFVIGGAVVQRVTPPNCFAFNVLNNVNISYV